MIGRIVMLAAATAVSSASLAFAQPRTPSVRALTGAAAAPATSLLHYVVAPTGNEGRYRVREMLFGKDFPNDAIGRTTDITGGLTVDPTTGKIVGDGSQITINVSKMASDQPRRDKVIRTQSIQTDKYPTVVLVPKTFIGLTARPGAAPLSFDFIGDLTVHGTTRSTKWNVTAHSDGEDILGTARTAFTFADFSFEKPHSAMALSVEDTIKLEYDFRFTPGSKATP
jgi:polyisoprenoid-binding protein YceI